MDNMPNQRKQWKAEDFWNAIKRGEKIEEVDIHGDVDIGEKSGISRNQQGRYVIDTPVVCERSTFWGKVILDGITFKESVRFEGSTSTQTTFSQSASFLATCFEKEAYFNRVGFSEEVLFGREKAHGIFDRAVFKSRTTSKETNFLKKVHFSCVQFSGPVSFGGAIFHDDANFDGASFTDNTYHCARFDTATYMKTLSFNQTTFARPAIFQDIKFYPDTIGHNWRCRRLNPFRKPPTYPDGEPKGKGTEFLVDTGSIDKLTNPYLRRYIADQQYIRSFQRRHPTFACIWRKTSDYGRSFTLWGMWSGALILVFAFIYAILFKHSFAFSTRKSELDWMDALYYSVVTFATLGYGDIVPVMPGARAIAMLEVLVGYVMLGGLISIFANKMAQRS